MIRKKVNSRQFCPMYYMLYFKSINIQTVLGTTPKRGRYTKQENRQVDQDLQKFGNHKSR